MKKTAENRYPNSATLFRFCKEALEIRYEGNVKVIDQDVGAILGYDPADCSHWKKGKKNIRSLATIKSIADHLSIDERLLIDIASGRVGLEEAVFEYRGYGAFYLQGKTLDTLKKEFFRNPSKWGTETTSKLTFEELFDINREAVNVVVQEVLDRGHFTEAPIYIPEIGNLFPNITLTAVENLEKPIEVTTEGDGSQLKMTIKYHGPDMRPFLRFLIAKEIYHYLVASGTGAAMRLQNAPAEVQEVRANIFAGMLLVPGTILRQEVESIDSSKDIIAQLAEGFWVSKALMNQRLRDYMEHLN